MYIQRWQHGALGRTWWTAKANRQHDQTDTYATPAELWQAADEFCKSGRRVVLWAYDLALQLRLSQGLVHLPELGWRLDKIVLERTAAWALFRDGERTLLMCDVKSWAPVEWEALVDDVRAAGVKLPQLAGGTDFHARRCARSVEIVRAAVLQILAWINGENLGPFRPTGSGQSYAGYRRRFMTHNLLAHDDTERLHHERLAMWTGRCEAWQHGHLNIGSFVEYDMQAAYCRIAAECDVPTIAQGEIRARSIDRLLDLSSTQAVLAHVTVKTKVPCLPTRMGGRTLWPVGEFSTWIWDPELQLAAMYCDDVKIHRAYRYVKEPALRTFARWVLDGMSPQTTVYGEVPKRVLKHWSRCLVGRLGLRFRYWTPFGTQSDLDLRLITYMDTDEGTSTDMLIAGHDRMILTDMAEGRDSMPQIPSWVMSECRRRLWNMMGRIGMRDLVYVDTDSAIWRAAHNFNYSHELHHGDPSTWIHKGTYESVTIHGPRNLACNISRRTSGVPLSAKQVAPLEFTGQIMRSIKESMRNGELDCIASIPRRFVLDAPDLRRQHLPYGATAPFHVQLPTSED